MSEHRPGLNNIVPFARDAGFLRTRARDHARAGRMLEALELYRMGVKHGADTEDTLALADHYSAMGAYELSNRLLFALLQRGERPAACFAALGANHFAMQDARRAQDCLLTALRLDPEAAFAEQAEAILDQLDAPALESPYGMRVNKAMARGLRALEEGQADSAQRWLQYAMVRQGADAQVLAMLAYAQLAAGDPRQSLATARQAHRADRGCAYALCAIACALHDLGQTVLSAKYLDRAEQCTTTPQEYALLCQSACETGAHDLALLLLRAIHAEQPYTPSLLHMLATACWNTGQVRQAVQYWGTLRRIDPGNLVAQVLHGRAVARAAHGETQEPPPPEEQCAYRMELPLEDCIDTLTDLHRTLQGGAAALQDRFDRDNGMAAMLAWGFSVVDADNATRFAMLSLLSGLTGERADAMLLSLLTDATQGDEVRRAAMGALARRGLKGPHYMEQNGRILRVMGQVTQGAVPLSSSCERILQEAVDTLTPQFGDVVQALSALWLPCAARFAGPGEPVCRPRLWVTALEAAYRLKQEPGFNLKALARRQRLSPRALRRFVARLTLSVAVCATAYEKEEDHGGVSMH